MKRCCSLKCCPEQLMCLPRRIPPPPKGMRSKDRLTMLFCSNADGLLKIVLAIVESSKNPRCVRMEKAPLYYMFQNKAWSGKRTLLDGFFQCSCLLSGRMCPHPKKVELLMENFAAHDKDVLVHDRADIFCLPPNCTAIHQPMDA